MKVKRREGVEVNPDFDPAPRVVAVRDFCSGGQHRQHDVANHREPNQKKKTPALLTPGLTDMTGNDGEATVFLASLLNKTLRVHTTDSRIFVGSMKCTDQERNIILSLTHEYRQPSRAAIESKASEMEQAGDTTGSIKVDMLKRFVGLVVVPGRYITKVEVEE